ncbi:MAG TPA: mechanosensitive ion channel family protein [Terriglobales bacterium]|nr:mechanosensitive ion channel family protein [Terriglobales bacterium]
MSFAVPRAARRMAICLAAALTLVLPLAGDEQQSPAQSLISFLNQTVVWYRQLTLQQQLATEPSDVLFLNDNRQLGEQIVGLSFEFARARAQAIMAQPGPAVAPDPDNPSASRYQNLATLAAQADNQAKQIQAELDSQKQQLPEATGKKRRMFESAIAETQSELELVTVRRDTLRSLLQFVSGANAGGATGGGLLAQIEELARTVPGGTGNNKGQPSGGGAAVQQTQVGVPSSPRPQPSGILGLSSDLITLRHKLRALEEASRSTDSLQKSARSMMTPMIANIKDLAKRGNEISSAPDATDPAVLAQQKEELDGMTAQYKQLSASVLPLGKQSVLLDLYKRSLGNWRNTVENEYSSELRGLILRLAVLAAVLIIVFAISEVWRRATFRYVQDVRRRYQFLLLRRIVVWFLVALIIAVAFASELGSLATFAGLLTAGVAVALQNVILSVAGYFFLIGKYGVRVGDRVQVAGVTGDVIDIGLVRLHLMEMGGSGSSARPTGRVVVFSNAVVFQANAGLFKQIPGTKFVWHEITFTLASDSDYHQVEQRMLNAVTKIYAEYRDDMERQRRTMERSLSPLSVHPMGPESRLRLTQSGVEVMIRYPVELDKSSEIDDRIARELLDVTQHDPKLKVAGNATPTIEPLNAGETASTRNK